MSETYEIIVLDLDGTLTNSKKVITPKTKEALMRIQKEGKKVVLALNSLNTFTLPKSIASLSIS